MVLSVPTTSTPGIRFRLLTLPGSAWAFCLGYAFCENASAGAHAHRPPLYGGALFPESQGTFSHLTRAVWSVSGPHIRHDPAKAVGSEDICLSGSVVFRKLSWPPKTSRYFYS